MSQLVPRESTADPHPLPSDWTWRPQEHVFDFQGGAQPPKSTFTSDPAEGYVRLVQIRDYNSNANITYVPDSPSLRKCDADDVMIARYGSGTRSNDSLGRIARGIPGAYNVALVKATPRNGIANDFLYYLLQTPYFQHPLRGQSARSVQAGFNRASIRAIALPIPPLQEQAAIAEILGALDDKIAANDRIGALSKELLAAVFRRLDVDEAGDTALEAFIEFNPKLKVADTPEVPYLEMKNLPDSSMTVSEWSHRPPRGGARFQNGDTLVARITPCLENGKVGMVDFLSGAEVAVGSTEFIVMRARPGVPVAFPYFLATSDRFREFAIRHMVGTTGRQRLAATDLAPYRVRRASPDALDRFGSLADAVLARVKAAVDESRALAQTRDELLPALMSGRVRVEDVKKSLEEVL